MKMIKDGKKRCVFGILVVIVVLFCNTSHTVDAGTTVMGESNIIFDGYYDDWADKPHSWEYNWDNSSNCWIWGVYIDGVKYMTQYGTYDENVRHKMSLFCDGKYVYLYVKFSRDYGARFNGEDYQFWFDDQVASVQVERVGGGLLTEEINNYSPGIYPVEVHHREQSMSYGIAQGSSAYITVHPNQINNELELKMNVLVL